jgi:hypothetical protein
MTHLKSFITKENEEKEYKINDIDHPNGWDWKEIDMLYGMGFEPEGDARMILKVKNQKLNQLKLIMLMLPEMYKSFLLHLLMVTLKVKLRQVKKEKIMTWTYLKKERKQLYQLLKIVYRELN